MEMQLTITIEMEEGFEPETEDLRLWLENEILIGDGSLMLHSNEIGDTVGIVKKVRNIQYLPSTKPSTKEGGNVAKM